MHPHNCRSALRSFLKNFAQWKRPIGMKKIFIIFSKKILVWSKWAILGPKITHPHKSGLALRIYFWFCTMKGANENFISCFSRKNCHLEQFDLFRLFYCLIGYFWNRDRPLLLLDPQTVMISSMITAGSLSSQDISRFLTSLFT